MPSSPRKKAAARGTRHAKPRLLSGGNPQVAKGDGDAPVRLWLAALDGWKALHARDVDALVTACVPHVQRAVRWNSPFYGVEGQGWFLSLHVFTRYLKLTFFKGALLRPLPPGGTPRSGDARWVDVAEGPLDTAQLSAWIRQAAALPGWKV